MRELLEKVEKQLESIGDKGLTSSNLDTTYKLIDIYKDIKEAKYYEDMCHGGGNMYEARGGRGGNYNDNYNRWDEGYNTRGWTIYPNERTERYMTRMRDGMETYNAGRNRYRDGGSNDRMVEGIEMTMEAIVKFIESLMDLAETPQEKEIVKKYIDKIHKI